MSIQSRYYEVKIILPPPHGVMWKGTFRVNRADTKELVYKSQMIVDTNEQKVRKQLEEQAVRIVEELDVPTDWKSPTRIRALDILRSYSDYREKERLLVSELVSCADEESTRSKAMELAYVIQTETVRICNVLQACSADELNAVFSVPDDPMGTLTAHPKIVDIIFLKIDLAAYHIGSEVETKGIINKLRLDSSRLLTLNE